MSRLRARYTHCTHWRILSGTLLTLAMVTATATPPADARRDADRVELQRLSDVFHQTLEQRRPPAYYRLLESTDPAARRLNEDPTTRLMYFDSHGLPTYYGTCNTYAASVIYTNQVWPGGSTGYDLNGLGTVAGELAIWDVGAVRLTHQEFGGRVTQMDTAVTTDPHSTHVSGTMIAAGVDPDAKGMSYRAPLHAYEWDDDLAEMAAAAAQGLLVSNHSYGLHVGWYAYNSRNWFGDITVDPVEDYRFGFYGETAQAMDEIAYNAPYYTIVRAAGNDVDDTEPLGGESHYHLENGMWVEATDYHQRDDADNTGEDTIPEGSCAKNILTVGAIGKDYTAIGHPLDVTGFSSSGPTDDGRIKPDVVALGENLWSPSDESDASYREYDGTSMAAPCVSGSVNLLAQHYKSHYGKLPRSSSMRGLIIHTADNVRWETPPAARVGWGKMNTRAAAELIAGEGYAGGGIMEATLLQGETHTYYFDPAAGGDQFTIAWTDPPGTPPAPSLDPPTPMLVNDLDMRVEYLESGAVFAPINKDWSVPPPRPIVTGDNSVDNVERIDSYNPDNEILAVTITHKGTLTDGEQTYSLVYSGVTPSQPDAPAGGPTSIATVDLGYPGASSMEVNTDNERRGIFFTAIEKFDIDAVGFRMAIPCENTLTVRLYSAHGSTRIGELASATVVSRNPGDIFHYVPLNYTLEPCQDYELTIEYQDVIRWWMWNENLIEMPYDAGGVVRVTDGEWYGNPGSPVLPHFALAGRNLGEVTPADLAPAGIAWDSSTDTPGERGVFVTAEQTATLSVVRWGASVPAFSSHPIEASIYAADGTTRGARIAHTRTTVLNLSPSSGMKLFTIPINATLVEGKDYNLSVTFDPTSFQIKDESLVTLPYPVDGLLTVVDGEAGGDPADTLLTHFGVNWSAGAGGTPHDLAGPTGPAAITSSAIGAPGILTTVLINEQLYSIGWMADVPDGATLGARLYEFTSFYTAPVLVAEGEIVSTSAGMRWHDIPVAARLTAGQAYIIEMVPSSVNAWEYWSDLSGMPYEPYGVIEVVQAVLDRAAAGDQLPHARVNLCNTTLTGVDDRPVTPPAFFVSAPYPNPASGATRVDYTLDEPATVWMSIYDVAGRRVATVLDGAHRPAGAGTAHFDTSGLPAGIYFLEMRSPSQRVARKIAIVK